MIQLAGIELAGQIAGEHLHQMQLDIRIARTHRLDQRQRQHLGRGRCQTDTHMTAHTPALGCTDRQLGLAKRQLGMMQEGNTGIGRHHASAGAIQ
ncbi:hypothetical protein D3C78_1430220 [compost metagenome]